MRKSLLRFLLAMLVTTVCLCGGSQFPAHAESTGQILNVEVIASPDMLVVPGEVALNFIIRNPGDADLENICLSSADGLESEPIGGIEAGATESFSRIHSVTQAELDAGEIMFILSHDDPVDPDHKINYGIHARLGQSDTRISAEMLRTFSTTVPAAGSTVTVAYTVRNTGNVPLQMLCIEDTLGDFSGRVDILEAGKSTVLVSKVAINEPALSHVTLLYRAETTGEEEHRLALEDVPIEIAAPQLQLQITANASAFSSDTADVQMILTNVGNVGYENVYVIDDIYGGVIAEGIALPVGGDPVIVAHTYAVRGDGIYRWRVVGKCGDGSRLELPSDTVQPQKAEDDRPAQMAIRAEVEPDRIRKAGNVHLHVYLENLGSMTLSDIVLSDAERGELYKFAVLPVGESIEKVFSYRVESDSEFLLTAACAEGIAESTEALRVVIAADGVLPEGEKEHFIEFSGGSIKIGGSALFAALLIAGCAALLVLVIMLMIASRRAHIEKQVRIETEKRRRRSKSQKAKNEKGRSD